MVNKTNNVHKMNVAPEYWKSQYRLKCVAWQRSALTTLILNSQLSETPHHLLWSSLGSICVELQLVRDKQRGPEPCSVDDTYSKTAVLSVSCLWSQLLLFDPDIQPVFITSDAGFLQKFFSSTDRPNQWALGGLDSQKFCMQDHCSANKSIMVCCLASKHIIKDS